MHFSLVMKLNDGTERKFPLRQNKTLIGRETRCQVRIALPTVAERHCEIVLDNDELKLNDLGSELGTFVNGAPVKKTVIGPADELTVGPVTFHVECERATDANTGERPAHDVARHAASELEVNVNVRPSDRLAGNVSSPDHAGRGAARKDR